MSAQKFSCIKLKEEEKTRQGYFSTIVFKEKKSFKILRGKVVLNDETQEDAYVEIFNYHREKEKYIRVAGCRIQANGRFHFPNLPKGSYKMTISKDGGFQITEVFLKISPKSNRKDEFTAPIEVGY